MLGSVAFNVCGPLPGAVDDQIAGDQPPPGFVALQSPITGLAMTSPVTGQLLWKAA